MKIKKTVEMKFWELLKHIEDNNIKNGVFKTKSDSSLLYVWNGVLDLSNYKHMGINKKFEVEIEEEITKNTEFNNLKWTYLDTRTDDIMTNGWIKSSINEVLNSERRCGYKEVLAIYSCDKDGLLTLLWTKDEGLVLE